MYKGVIQCKANNQKKGTHFETVEMKTYQPKNHVYMNYLLDSGKKTLDEIDVETEFLIKLIKGEYRIMCHLNPNISYQCIFYIGRKISYE